MPPVGFKPTISAGERPQTNALDRAAAGTGYYYYYYYYYYHSDKVNQSCYRPGVAQRVPGS